MCCRQRYDIKVLLLSQYHFDNSKLSKRDMQIPDWTPVSREYEKEQVKLALERQTVVNHPLLPRRAPPPPTIKAKDPKVARRSSGMKMSSVADADPLGGSSDPLSESKVPDLDPLSVSNDPLSMMMGSDSSAQSSKVEQRKQASTEAARQAAIDVQQSLLNTPWQIKKQQILKDFTVTGNITIGANSINEFAGSGVEDGSSTRAVDKYTRRLANLERKPLSSEKVELSQKEYVDHIKYLEESLKSAWVKEERVQTLKFAIQLAKLLADTNVPLFYPSMFVMVTDVLDRFGEMVYARLLDKSEQGLLEEKKVTIRKKARLPDNFTSADVPSIAKETCRNWFYKIACIKELLPRIYIETALLKCFRFISDNDFPQILTRLGTITRGVGDPLVSIFVKTYIMVTGSEVAPNVTIHGNGIVQDTLLNFGMLKSAHHLSEIQKLGITPIQYMHSLSPGVEWLLKCMGKSASKESFQGLLQWYREKCNNSLVLKYIIDAFDASHYAHGALGMVTLIKSSEPSSIPPVELYTSLGRQLVVHPPPEEQRLVLLNDVWKYVSRTEDIGAYIRCSSTWLEVLYRHYSDREVTILLSDLTSKLGTLTPGTLPEQDIRHLETLLRGLIAQSSAGNLITDHMLKILDQFSGSRRVELCKDVLDSFKTHAKTNDAILIHTLFDIGKTLHDSLDCLSPEGEKKHIATLLCNFIEKIDFGKDLEQQLNTYVECRSIFSNLDLVKDKLITSVCALAVRAYGYMKGRHSKKTAAFAKACLAFCHITTPSINDVFRKLQLLLYCSQVALLNQCLPQTDTFLKAAISLIPEMPTHDEIDSKRVHTEEKLSIYLRSLLSTLVIAPGHPEHGPFYIVQGLLNALPRYQWQPTTVHRTRVYLDILVLLCTFAQRKFPYRIAHVESNDFLYGGGVEYMSELNTNITTCVQEMLQQLSVMGERTEPAAKLNQSRLVLDLANIFACRMQIKSDVGVFLVKLLELARRNKSIFTKADLRYMMVSMEFIRSQAEGSEASMALNTAIRGMTNNN